MDVDRILQQLYDERQAVEELIIALERMAASRGDKPRGRPPKWLKEARDRLAESEKKS